MLASEFFGLCVDVCDPTGSNFSSPLRGSRAINLSYLPQRFRLFDYSGEIIHKNNYVLCKLHTPEELVAYLKPAQIRAELPVISYFQYCDIADARWFRRPALYYTKIALAA